MRLDPVSDFSNERFYAVYGYPFEINVAIRGLNESTDFKDIPQVKEMISRFASVYGNLVGESTGIQIPELSRFYLIGQVKKQPEIEATLCAGIEHGLTASLGPSPYCRPFVYLGLEYEGNDRNINLVKASLPVEPKNILERWGWKKVHQPSFEERYPFFNREYGARLNLRGRRNQPRVDYNLRDERLSDLVKLVRTGLELSR